MDANNTEPATTDIVTLENILPCVFVVRGVKAMLDTDLARLYEVETRQLNQAVKRNMERFPQDFMFQLSPEEFDILRSQNVMSRWGGRRTMPLAFTEQGIAMLSSVLRSPKAIQVNVSIMRAFVRMRQLLTETNDLKTMVEQLQGHYDQQFRIVFEVLNQMVGEQDHNQKQIGFIWTKSDKDS